MMNVFQNIAEPYIPVRDGLVSYLDFNNKDYNAFGNRMVDITCETTGATSAVRVQSGWFQRVYVNASNSSGNILPSDSSYIVCTDDTFELSLGGWMYMTGATNTFRGAFGISMNASQNIMIRMNSTNKCYAQYDIFSVSTGSFNDTTTLVTNTWYHAMTTRKYTASGNNTWLYINGINKGGFRKNYAAGTAGYVNGLTIGHGEKYPAGVNSGNLYYAWSGKLDKVRLHNKWLSDQQVKNIYDYECQAFGLIP
jgi:hypothetical protein